MHNGRRSGDGVQMVFPEAVVLPEVVVLSEAGDKGVPEGHSISHGCIEQYSAFAVKGLCNLMSI